MKVDYKERFNSVDDLIKNKKEINIDIIEHIKGEIFSVCQYPEIYVNVQTNDLKIKTIKLTNANMFKKYHFLNEIDILVGKYIEFIKIKKIDAVDETIEFFDLYNYRI